MEARYIPGFKDGRRGQMKDADSFQELDEASHGFCPEGSRGNQLCYCLDFSPLKLTLDF